MFSAEGPTVRELAVQALSSVERGYDLLAPKFDHTPFRTPDVVLDAVAEVARGLGPFGRGLDLCCGTGAGTRVLRRLCRDDVVGVDLSAGMLAVARRHEDAVWVRGEAGTLPFGRVFDVVASFGAFGHFRPEERPGVFAEVARVLRPGGRFLFPIAAPPRPGGSGWWFQVGFDAAMRVRNAVWRPPFVMYYRTFRLADVRAELCAAGFDVELYPLEALGRRPDGAPRCRLVAATLR
ncbi:class I SAM-dependent methyltransferase [Streptomyces durbertensis]|uniref:Class I SAM-dependent methyltransferase n=1 Tax=Streptomyces durbertensis TaxID=2448886 RepID=A0ABR6EBE6_9ACTN|nr:class I SAM-dependent methyltransferase [Streptomyces durbertensis]MBB1242660.1 class I SAM-dependent methyltransferase [Streptomyces durbertensis]